MKTTFRLYNRLHASIFDLIDGNGETQQTKGLALVLSKCEEVLKAFFKLRAIKDKVGEIEWAIIDETLINAELISTTGKQFRADIVIRLYARGKPYKMIMIEAKGLNKNTSVEAASAQIENYLRPNTFKEFGAFNAENIYGFTLTKYPTYVAAKQIGTIVWNDVIKLFYHMDKSKNELLNDYFQFITKINEAMYFYEKEVFSIPTADWSNKAINNFHVYECPNSGRYQIKQKPLYLTFRKSGGGEMEKLYKIEEIIILSFSKDYQTFLEDDRYSETTRKCVRNYVDYMQQNNNWGEVLPDDEKQVLVLSEQTIELPHKPKPRVNNSFRAYYKLSDLLNLEKKILDQNPQEEA